MYIQSFLSRDRVIGALRILAVALFLLSAPTSRAVIRDGDIDSQNLGKGTWIYILPNAINHLGIGNISAVTNESSLMIYMKNHGVTYFTIKAAQGDTLYPSSGNPALTPALINAAHAAGLKIFGYIYTTGVNVPGEIAMADYIFQQGADGLIYDAESEWETVGGSPAARSALATNLCGTVRAHWPNKFIGLSTWPYRAVHPNLPYKEFAYYCDVIMPQVYWIELGTTPTAAVTRMNNEWNTWKSGLSGKWTNAIKPFVVSGQGWNSGGVTVTPAQVAEFEYALKTIANPVSPGGYKAVDFWRAEAHPADFWDAIRTNNIGNAYTNAPVIQFAPSATVAATTASISWPTDQSSDSVVEYGLTTSYGSLRTNAPPIWYHTVNLTGLAPDTTYHYRVKSKAPNNLTGVSSDYVFTTANIAVSDIVIDQNSANNSGGNQITFTGLWTSDVAGAAYLGTFSYVGGVYTGVPNKTARFTPNIVTPGNYKIYASWASSSAGGNRSTNAPFRINHGTVTTARVNQEANGNSFQLIANSIFLPAGTSSYVELGNDVTASVGGDLVVADAVKFVYIPPPPTKPSISTQPLAQTITQGNPATFLVAASGTAPMTYQWKFNGANIPSATASTYTRNNVQPVDAGNYSVAITNSVGSSNSANAYLTVRQPPFITAAPQNVTTNVGSNVTFFVTATGTAPLYYRWQFENVEISGATSSTFQRANVQPEHVGTYTVVVTNVVGTTSADATLDLLSTEPLQLLSPVFSNGAFQFQLSGAPGNYILQGSSNLSTWIDLTNIANTNGIVDFVESETNQTLRYYRAKPAP